LADGKEPTDDANDGDGEMLSNREQSSSNSCELLDVVEQLMMLIISGGGGTLLPDSIEILLGWYASSREFTMIEYSI